MPLLLKLSFALIVVTLAHGCAHRAGRGNVYLHGRPPEQNVASTVGASPLQDLHLRVEEAVAEARRGRPEVSGAPTIESTDRMLGTGLAALAAGETAARHRAVAVAYLRVGVRDRAMDHCTSALLLEPDDAGSYELRARIWRDWGFPHLGLGDAHRAAFHAPDSAPVHNTLGTLLQRTRQYQAARAEYERALAIEVSAYALSNLCALELELDRPAVAATWCRRALALDRDFDAAQFNLLNALSLLDPAEKE